MRRLYASLFAIFLPVIAQLYHTSNGGYLDVGTFLFERHQDENHAAYGNVTLRGIYKDEDEIESRHSIHTNVTTIKRVHAHNGGTKAQHRNINSTQLDSLFDVKDLDVTRRTTCGWEKCFFHSKSDKHVGYLLAPTTKRTRRRFKAIEGAYKYAEYLKREYNITHFLLAPPTRIKVTKSLESRLNHNLWDEHFRRSYGKRYKRFKSGQTIVAQTVQKAPKEMLLLGCKKSKLHAIQKNMDKFIVKIKDTESFAKRFKESFAETRQLLQKEPGLALDFQVWIDTSANIYHLDFDRAFNTNTAQQKRKGYPVEKLVKSECYKTLDTIERRVNQAIKKAQRREKETRVVKK